MMSRRILIGTGIVGFAAGLSGGLGLTRYGLSNTDRLRALITCQDSAAEIGRVYLRSVGGKVDLGSLVEELCGSNPTDDQLRQVVMYRIRRDFEPPCRIVDVGGWVLSETEVKLCAIALGDA